MAPTQPILSHVRVAPLQTAGRQSISTDSTARTVSFTTGKPWSFDGVYTERENNRTVFFRVGAPLVRAALSGANATLIAHGQSATGKSYSIHDPSKLHTSAEGLAPRMLRMLLERTHAASLSGTPYELRLQYLHVRGEFVYDLLAPEPDAPEGATQTPAPKQSYASKPAPKHGDAPKHGGTPRDEPPLAPPVPLREDGCGVYAKGATWHTISSTPGMLEAISRAGTTPAPPPHSHCASTS